MRMGVIDMGYEFYKRAALNEGVCVEEWDKFVSQLVAGEACEGWGWELWEVVGEVAYDVLTGCF